MREAIKTAVSDAKRAIDVLEDVDSVSFMEVAAMMIAQCFSSGSKLLLAGNGGSLCDAMHIAEEFTGYYRKPRRALPAVVLSEPGHLTCVSNDSGFDQVFARGVEALGNEGDIFCALSTSGNSSNILLALETAKKKKLKTIAFLGKTGGKTKGVADLEWIVEGFEFSDRIQEAHMTAAHIIIEMVERMLFYDQTEVIEKLLEKTL